MIQVRRGLMVVVALALVACLAVPALAEDKNTDNKIALGTIKSVTADQNQFMVTDKDGKDWTYQVNEQSKFFVPKEANAKLSDLKTAAKVAIAGDKTGEQSTAL